MEEGIAELKDEADAKRFEVFAEKARSFLKLCREENEMCARLPLPAGKPDEIFYKLGMRLRGLRQLSRLLEFSREMAEVLGPEGKESLDWVNSRTETIKTLMISASKPLLYREAILKILPDFDIDSTPGIIEAALVAFDSLSLEEQLEFEYVAGLLNTEDTIGIILRGHVLIDRRLRACIEQYVPNKPGLLDRTDVTFSMMLDLAIMLGVISPGEHAIIRRLNKIRNSVAHDVQYRFDHGTEKTLWELVASTEQIQSVWGPYKREIFPASLVLIVQYLCLSLDKRIDALAARRLSRIVDEIQAEDGLIGRQVRAAWTPLMVRLNRRVAQERRAIEAIKAAVEVPAPKPSKATKKRKRSPRPNS